MARTSSVSRSHTRTWSARHVTRPLPTDVNLAWSTRHTTGSADPAALRSRGVTSATGAPSSLRFLVHVPSAATVQRMTVSGEAVSAWRVLAEDAEEEAPEGASSATLRTAPLWPLSELSSARVDGWYNRSVSAPNPTRTHQTTPVRVSTRRQEGCSLSAKAATIDSVGGWETAMAVPATPWRPTNHHRLSAR